jgi:hypothetical protein
MGVNVAAPLESLAEPGGICISGTVREQVRDKVGFGYDDRGEQTVKNIARTVRVCRVLFNGAASPARGRRIPRKYLRGGVHSAAGIVIVITFVVVEHLSLRPPTTYASIATPHPSAYHSRKTAGEGQN